MRPRSPRALTSIIGLVCLVTIASCAKSVTMPAKPLSWSAPISIDAGNSILSVSCPSSTFCMAVDGNGGGIDYDGTSWSSPLEVDGGGVLSSVSCPSSSFCMAVDSEGNAFSYNGSSWSSGTSIYNGSGGLPIEYVSCTSASFCMAAGDNNIMSYNGSSWSSVATSAVTDTFISVSCTSSSFCVLVDILTVGFHPQPVGGLC